MIKNFTLFCYLCLISIPFSVYGQAIDHLTGFNLTNASDKEVYNIIKLDENTSLVLFTKPKMLWRSDGTMDGTYLLHNWDGETGIQNGIYCNILGVVNGKAIMLITTSAYGKELWASDGTVNGTQLLVDYFPGGNGLVDEENNTSKTVLLDGFIYFFAKQGSDYHLMRTDGSIAGTEVYINKVAKVNNSTGGHNVPQLFHASGNFYFINDELLYRINDQTKLTTKAFLDNAYDLNDLAFVNDSTVLLATTQTFESAVYSYNVNSKKLDKLLSGDQFFPNGDKYIYYGLFIKFNDKFYIATNDDDGTKINSTDGTVNGTTLVGEVDNEVERFIEYNSKLWFGAFVNNIYQIMTIDDKDFIKVEFNSMNIGGAGRRGFGLMSNNKFFSSSAYSVTGNDYEPHSLDPALKSITKISNLNVSSHSYPELFTEINSNKYFFYADDELNEGSLYVMVIDPTATYNQLINSSVNVSPNPTSNIWNINFENSFSEQQSEYILYDAIGKIIDKGKMIKDLKLDSGDMATGLYFLQIQSGDYRQSLKLLKY